MSIEKSKELQERIVITIFENAPENWDKYCQYLELIPLDDDFDNSLLSVWFNGSEEMDYKINASNEYALYKLFAELNTIMVNKEKEELYFKNTSQNKLRIGVTNRAFPKKCVTII